MRNDNEHSESVASRNLTYEGRCEIEHGGHIYQVEFDCEVVQSEWANKQWYVSLDDAEFEIGGKPVIERALRRDLRSKIVDYIELNHDKIIRGAK